MAIVDNPTEILEDVHDTGLASLRSHSRWTFLNTTSKASTQIILAAPGVLHSVTINSSAGHTDHTVAIYDGATAGATTSPLFLQDPPKVGNYIFDADMTAGIVIKSAGSSAQDVTVTYKEV